VAAVLMGRSRPERPLEWERVLRMGRPASCHATQTARKRFLIVNPRQFGYEISPYHYCRYLSRNNDVSYVCWDYGLQKIEEQKVHVSYVSRNGNKIRRLWRFIAAALEEMKRLRYDVIIVVRFDLCSILRLLERSQLMVLDIRTGFIGKDFKKHRRKIHNKFINFESRFYDKVTIISDALREDLQIGKEKSHVLPLGAEAHRLSDKSFDAMHLLYVGTFNHRCIDKTVAGFDLFYKEVGSHINMTYDIVGYGAPFEEQAIVDAIEKTNCKHLIRFHGHIPHKKLNPFLDRNNIGIAFVPMLDQYQSQPTTKIFEYHLAGMPVLATATRENSRVINISNGVLIGDDMMSFYNGLKTLYHRLPTYNSTIIKLGSAEYEWERIISNNLAPYLYSLIEDNYRQETSYALGSK
jgi:hypothetical protein